MSYYDDVMFKNAAESEANAVQQQKEAETARRLATDRSRSTLRLLFLLLRAK